MRMQSIQSRLKAVEKQIKQLSAGKQVTNAELFKDWTTEELKEYVHHFELGTPISEKVLQKAEKVAKEMEKFAK